MIPATLREAYEIQATACLEAAERHHALLLAVARKLAGTDEGGREVFQQAVLNCHDAIQRGGFRGERYEFYLLKTIHNLHRRQKRQEQKHLTRPLTADDGHAPTELEPRVGALAQLADTLLAEARERFPPADRIALRLHCDGHSLQHIADMTGAESRFHVRRQLDRMKAELRETFQQAWDALGE